MFRHEGPARTIRKNAILAGYLALVAGFVNSGGFLLVGSFTSHVTGAVGRISNELAAQHFPSAALGLLMVASFFSGAVFATLVIESSNKQRPARAYGRALLFEAITLAAFIFVAGFSEASHPLIRDAEATMLCAAMGMQNSMVTRLSGAVVRTTHLTGVVTDLGIEAGRWYRWHRAKLHMLPSLLQGSNPPARPNPESSLILVTVIGGFAIGALLGAVLTQYVSRWAMVAPSFAVMLASLFAFRQDRLVPGPVTVPPKA